MIKQLPLLLASAMLGTAPMIDSPSSVAPSAPIAPSAPVALSSSVAPAPPALPSAPDPMNAEKICYAVRAFCGGSYLGVELTRVDQEKMNELGLKEAYGAVIVKVIENSPASKAGLQVNDVIVGWNGIRVLGVNPLIELVRATSAGSTVALEVIRAGTPMKLSATVEERGKEDYSFFIPKFDSTMHLRMEELGKRLEGYGKGWDSLGTKLGREIERRFIVRRPRLGVELQELSVQLGKYFGAEAGSGALIGNVIENSAAAKGGLRAGDVITAIDGEKVKAPGDVVRIISRKLAGEITITVLRDKREQTIRVTLEGNQQGRSTDDPSSIEREFAPYIQ